MHLVEIFNIYSSLLLATINCLKWIDWSCSASILLVTACYDFVRFCIHFLGKWFLLNSWAFWCLIWWPIECSECTSDDFSCFKFLSTVNNKLWITLRDGLNNERHVSVILHVHVIVTCHINFLYYHMSRQFIDVRQKKIKPKLY